MSLLRIRGQVLPRAQEVSSEGRIRHRDNGERIGDSELAIELYGDMACLFDSFEGWNMGFITSHDKFEESIGRKATSVKSLKCGNLDTRFYIY